jgi:hypothetical protein
MPYGEMGDFYELPESQLEVVTWTPAQHGKSVPGEQVHLMFHVSEDMKLVVRLKSKAAVDRVIGILQDHRDSANWGPV